MKPEQAADLRRDLEAEAIVPEVQRPEEAQVPDVRGQPALEPRRREIQPGDASAAAAARDAGPRAEVRGVVPGAQEAERVLADFRLEFEQGELVGFVSGGGGECCNEPKDQYA